MERGALPESQLVVLQHLVRDFTLFLSFPPFVHLPEGHVVLVGYLDIRDPFKGLLCFGAGFVGANVYVVLLGNPWAGKVAFPLVNGAGIVGSLSVPFLRRLFFAAIRTVQEILLQLPFAFDAFHKYLLENKGGVCDHKGAVHPC